VNDQKHVLGGDTPLSFAGQEYAIEMCKLINERETLSRSAAGVTTAHRAMVLAGTLKRYDMMAEELSKEAGGRKRKVLHIQRLNELCAGSLDSLSYDQMKAKYPNEFKARLADKLHYRYPGVGGESYTDVIMRLQETVLLLEQLRNDVIVVCDRAVCRVLIGYFHGTDLPELPYMEVKGGVIEFKRNHSGFAVTHLPVAAGRATCSAGPGTIAESQSEEMKNLSLEESQEARRVTL